MKKTVLLISFIVLALNANANENNRKDLIEPTSLLNCKVLAAGGTSNFKIEESAYHHKKCLIISQNAKEKLEKKCDEKNGKYIAPIKNGGYGAGYCQLENGRYFTASKIM